MSDSHNDQRLFSKSSLASLFFGKGETANTVKSIGAEVKIPKRPKNPAKIPQNPSTSSAAVQNLPPLEKDTKDVTVDGEVILGVNGQSVVTQSSQESNEDFAKTEDWVLQRLFKKPGFAHFEHLEIVAK